MVSEKSSVIVLEQSVCARRKDVSDGVYQSLSAISIASLVSMCGSLSISAWDSSFPALPWGG